MPCFLTSPRRDILVCIFLLAAIWIAYGQVHNFSFVNYDDPDYITENVHVRGGLTAHNVAWAFSTTHGANWFPITWLSHMLDFQLFGLASGWHHLTSVLIHSISTILLYALLLRMTRAPWPSAFVAFVFALHPLHVESVVWVAERKDVLCALFFILALHAYVNYVKLPSARNYALLVVLFCLGLMSKPMMVTLPVVALLLDYWPLERTQKFSRLLIEKLPLFAFSAASAIITFIVQRRGGAVLSIESISLMTRLENAAISVIMYLAQFVSPAKLAVFYPYPHEFAIWRPIAACITLAGITTAVILARRHKYLVTGWFWFLGMLAPVIGIVQVGLQARADRYTYLPLIGFAIVIAWGLTELLRERWQVLAAAGAVACAVWIVLTSANVTHWRNSVALFQHALDVTEENYVAHNNLGEALRRQGKIDDAIPHFQAALEIRPLYPEAENNLGEALLMRGRVAEAMPYLNDAARQKRSSPEVHVNLGAAFMKQGEPDRAAGEYRTAIKLDPDDANAHCGLGVALTEAGHVQEALPELTEAIQIKPEDADAHYNLGRADGLLGRNSEAIAEFMETIRLEPGNAEAHYNLGTALAAQEKFKESADEFRAAIRLKPDYVSAYFNLASALATLGQFDEAIQGFSDALRLRPDFVEARQARDQCMVLRQQVRR